jgi:hypothetical protein
VLHPTGLRVMLLKLALGDSDHLARIVKHNRP